MQKISSTAEQFFPSLLDRIVDDRHVNEMIEQCKSRIKAFEEKLTKASEETAQKTKNQWIESRKELLRQVAFLYDSTGSLNEIKACVKRDLEWLLNTHNLCLDELLEESYPNVESAVLNYGLPDLTGKTASSINTSKLETLLKRTIKQFEPRIIPRTLQVKLLKNKQKFDHNALVFEISGDLWTGSRPVHLQITTQLDLENGNVEFRD